jgi:uncharacterized membrane protein
MKNYTAAYVNPKTFEQSVVETKIPTDIVNEIQRVLSSMGDYYTTPTLINPENGSVVIGIIDTEDRSVKYKLSITPKVNSL